MSKLSSRIKNRKTPHKDVPICLDLDLLTQRDEALRASTARRPNVQDDRLVTPAAQKSAHVADLERQIAENSITLRIKGVDRSTYNQWIVECPPRKGKQETYNPETFFIHAAKNSAVYVDENRVEEEIDDEDWETIDKFLTDGEHDRIAQAVVYVNRSVGAVDVSSFGNASETTRDSFGISASRETSESHRDGSGAGKPKKSTSKTPTMKATVESE